MDPITLTIPFPGFYDSPLSAELDRAEEQLIGYLTGKGDYASDEPEFPNVSEQDAAEALMDAVAYGVAHRQIAKDYAEQFAHCLNANLPDNCAPFALTFESMDSPREYNFTTDRVYMRLPLSDFVRMRAALDPAIWEKTLRAMFTSYDGFSSFYSNDPAEWADKPLSEYDHNEAGAVLRAYLATHWPEFDEWTVIEGMSEGNVFDSALDAALDMDKLRGLLAEKATEAAEG